MSSYLISGQSGVALSLKDNLLLYSDGTERRATTHLVNEVFRYSSDCVRSEHYNAEAALVALDTAKNQDLALRFFLSWIDLNTPTSLLPELGEMLEELLEAKPITTFLENTMLSRLLPAGAVRQPNDDDCHFDQPYQIWVSVLSLQKNIEVVVEGFHSTSSLFETVYDQDAFYDRAARIGATAILAKNLGDSVAWNKQMFSLIQEFASFPKGREIIQKWLGALPREQIRKPRPLPTLSEQEAIEPSHSQTDSAAKSGYLTLQNVKQQIVGIVEKLQDGDTKNALRFAEELVQSQKQTSSDEQIAKSLCAISQRAKDYGFIEIQEMWAREATNVAPQDARSYGHLADALIQQLKFVEAEEALKLSAQWGDEQYATTGRARIHSARGDFSRARDLYLLAVEKFNGGETEQISKVGAAEVLRDLERPDEALTEYKQIVRDHPGFMPAQCGLAATYSDLGQFDKAINAYDIALGLDQNSIVALNGRATVLRHRGSLDEAIGLYDIIIGKFPHDASAYCGRAEVLRAKGELQEAEKSYQEIVTRFPGNAIALNALGETQLALGRHNHALATFQTGEELFSFEVRFVTGKGRAQLAMGHFGDALVTFDTAAQKFPHNLYAKVGRAKSLVRLGKIGDAIEQYTALSKAHPKSMLVSLGLASAHISQERYDDAEKILPKEFHTEADWMGYFLKQFISLRKTNTADVLETILLGEKYIPFYSVRAKLRNLVATYKLKENLHTEALALIQTTEGEVSEVIHFHAVAATGNISRARGIYSEYIQSERPAQLFFLAEEVARRFGLINAPPKLELDTLVHAEASELLLEAA